MRIKIPSKQIATKTVEKFELNQKFPGKPRE